jgi:hypothetical protein
LPNGIGELSFSNLKLKFGVKYLEGFELNKKCPNIAEDCDCDRNENKKHENAEKLEAKVQNVGQEEECEEPVHMNNREQSSQQIYHFFFFFESSLEVCQQ